MISPLASVSAQRLVHLSPLDLAIIIFYFPLVLAIGFYLMQQRKYKRRLFHGWSRDDRMDPGSQLSFGKSRFARAHGMGWRLLSVRDTGRPLLSSAFASPLRIATEDAGVRLSRSIPFSAQRMIRITPRRVTPIVGFPRLSDLAD